LATLLAVWVFFFIVRLAFPLPLAAADIPVGIGVLAKRGSDQAATMWAPTAAYLSAHIPGYAFTIIPLDFKKIDQAVREQRVQFVLTNPAIYVGLQYQYGTTRIVTMENLRQGQGYTQFGGVIFCRADRADIQVVANLAGRSFMAVEENSFGGWLMAWREFQDHGIDPYHDFSSLQFGGTHDAVVMAVIEGRVDGGTVRTDTLERMAQEGKIRLADFRILQWRDQHRGGSTPSASFPFLVSTRLYPEWPFAKVAGTPEALSKQVAIALLNMPAADPAARAGQVTGWTTPLDYQSVHDCLKQLKVAPYAFLGRIIFADVVRQYWYWLLASSLALLAMIATTLFVLRLNGRLNHSRRQLARARDELEDKVAARTADLKGVNEDLRLEVTERRHAEESLQASEAKYRELFIQFHTLLDALPDNITLQSPDHKVLWANRAAAGGLHRHPDAMVGLYCYALRHNRTEPCASCPGEQSLHSGEPAMGEVATPDGRVWELRTIPIKEGDRVLNVIEVARDITEHRKLEAQLLQAQKLEAVGQLAGGVAHDFNNLLSVINGYAQLIMAQLPDNAPWLADLQEIDKAGNRAAALTRQLLAFSRKQVMQPEVLDLNAVVAGTEKMLQRLIGEDIDLVFVPDAALGRVKVDPGQIEQVIMNLAINARDAMPRGGKLTIETRDVELEAAQTIQRLAVEPGPYVLLAVADTGMGMDAGTMGQIFEPFFTTKGLGKGTGLGLASVYGIVKQSGGSIWVYSELGKGTTFKIYLPRVEEPVREGGEAQVESSARGVETLLVVEDEEGVRNLAAKVLAGAGYEVLVAANGEEALLLFDGHQGLVHLLLTDVVMPGMGGRELATRLGVIRPEMKVLFMSGYTNNGIVHHGVLDQGTQFIGKPFSVIDLTRKVREVLDL
jgi:signal transduction histidine kinase/ABC-type phosphate/phosphonate transport system substrate-binding protein